MISCIILAAVMGASSVSALAAEPPLASKDIPFGQIPYMVDTSDGPRGTQQGYNICNSTTEGPSAKCQTAFVNHIDDFCIWGAIKPNSLVANEEGSLVAYCSKPGHGSRVMPQGTLKGVQVIQTPGYIQVTGVIDQTLIGLTADDTGGEEDPHGADGRGNPLGSLLYSNAFPSSGGKNDSYVQCKEWHNFLGGGRFCIKCCDPKGPNAASLCEHRFDRIGCAYNAPADYKEGAFLSCKGVDQDPPGIFTGADGKVSTYSQPPESLGAISTIPYQPKVPATSECITYSSAQLYAAAASVAPNPTSKAPATTSAASTAKAPGASAASGGSAPASTAAPKNGAGKNVANAIVGLGMAAVGIMLFA